MKTNKLILSLESSDSTCGVALSENGKIIAEINYYGKNLHDRLLAKLSAQIMNDLGFEFSDLSAVAVSAGPGSFTGLRISAALAKGLCFDGEIRLIAVPNLTAFAFSALDDALRQKCNKIIAIIKSHGEFYYYQEFTTKDFLQNDIQLLNKSDFPKYDKVSNYYVGTADEYREILNITDNYDKPKAEFIANYANDLFDKNLFVSAEEYEPIYIQDFQPKVSTKKLEI